ncbi:MAG: (d)CMP kinase [Erysipelotrichaceae bacterium]|nr:(d)CMP kinase [Erysipelotrichaceae bacterium]
MKKINIAFDGPSAAGKSTIADLVAEKLGYTHLDTGAMYRAVAYEALQKGIALDDEENVVRMIEGMDLEMKADGSVVLNKEDISEKIRTNEISLAASDVSKLEKVRAALVAMQQKISRGGGYILDGRDIGTVVLKDAEVKIYLTASVESRALRRHKQNLEKGIESDLESIRRDIEKRDYQDTHREHSPLKKAEDAVEIDSSDLSIEEVVDAVMALVEKELN